jgi:deoxyribodipyrimidine photo-lyase
MGPPAAVCTGWALLWISASVAIRSLSYPQDTRYLCNFVPQNVDPWCAFQRKLVLQVSPTGGYIITSSTRSIVWFRQDLRLSDNPALAQAAAAGCILPVYILDDGNAGEWAMGGASRWWLHHSLCALSASLDHRLLVLCGDPLTLLPALAAAAGANAVYWNRCYEPWRIQRDGKLKKHLQENGREVHSFNAALLWEPWQVLKQDQTPYRVFTPFYRRGCLNAGEPANPLPAPARMNLLPPQQLPGFSASFGENAIRALQLLPILPWDGTMKETWEIGEQAAFSRLQEFLSEGLTGYREGRNFPSRNNVSRLSPYLHFGEISPRQVWREASAAGLVAGADADLDCFQSELGWREFSHSLLYYNPDLPRTPIQKRFNAFPWQENPAALHAWQQGNTGFPLIDAGMRELWQTGYMHNRVRMAVGSFLVKNLRLHWHRGEDWFWDCLVDADLANNSASWQWISGCGADASPYFRVFNPVTQSEKFDGNGEYLRRYLPELGRLSDKYIHAPSAAPASVLRQAGVILDENYPRAITDLRESREAALSAFKALP